MVDGGFKSAMRSSQASWRNLIFCHWLVRPKFYVHSYKNSGENTIRLSHLVHPPTPPNRQTQHCDYVHGCSCLSSTFLCASIKLIHPPFFFFFFFFFFFVADDTWITTCCGAMNIPRFGHYSLRMQKYNFSKLNIIRFFFILCSLYSSEKTIFQPCVSSFPNCFPHYAWTAA